MGEANDTNINVTALCSVPTKTNFGTAASVEETKMFIQAMPADQVAKEGVDGLLKNKRAVITGSKNKALAAKFLPCSTTAKVTKSITQIKKQTVRPRRPGGSFLISGSPVLGNSYIPHENRKEKKNQADYRR